MAKAPVNVPYEFEVDLDIPEDQIPNVKTVVLVDIPETENLDFSITNIRKTWREHWSFYGDGELIADTPYFKRLTSWDLPSNKFKYRVDADGQQLPDASSNGKWAWKDRIPSPVQGFIYLLEDFYDTFNYANPSLGSYGQVLNLPSSSYLASPYTTITICRNKTQSYATLNGINDTITWPGSSDIPDMIEISTTSDIINRGFEQKKIWIKTKQDPQTKKGLSYKLIVEGEFYKQTEKTIYITGVYPTTIYTYKAFNYYDNGWTWAYRPDGETETVGQKQVYGVNLTPSVLTLVVSFLNKNGNYEVKQFKHEV